MERIFVPRKTEENIREIEHIRPCACAYFICTKWNECEIIVCRPIKRMEEGEEVEEGEREKEGGRHGRGWRKKKIERNSRCHTPR